MSGLDEIKAKVEAEKRALVAKQREEDGLPPQSQNEGWPPEWYAERDRSAAAIQTLIGGTIVGGDLSDLDGSLVSLDVKDASGKVIQLVIAFTADGRVVGSIMDQSVTPELPPAAVAAQQRHQQQQ